MKPPTLARRLLALVAPDRTDLAGDLDERFQQVQSGAWYWRQVLGVVLYRAVAEIRTHPILTARAIVIGGLFLAITTRIMFALTTFPEWLFVTGIAPAPFRAGIDFPMWMRGFPAVALWKTVLFAASGWLVARTHHRNTSIGLSYAAFIWCGNAVVLAFHIADPRWPYSLTQSIADLLVLYPFAALCGGLLAAAYREQVRTRT